MSSTSSLYQSLTVSTASTVSTVFTVSTASTVSTISTVSTVSTVFTSLLAHLRVDFFALIQSKYFNESISNIFSCVAAIWLERFARWTAEQPRRANSSSFSMLVTTNFKKYAMSKSLIVRIKPCVQNFTRSVGALEVVIGL